MLRFGECKAGCRAYLAISGGCHVPEVLHSKSTYLLAKIGGYHGRPLQKNDQLKTGKPSGAAQQMLQSLQEKICCKQHFLELPWSLNPSFSPVLESAEKKPLKIRILKGKHFYWFNKVTRETFFQSSFQLSSQSDRMGYRLQGAELVCNQNSELLSEAVRFGTIQVPGDGNPIVLMADSQTTGGYPKIAETASIDLPALAQAKPGDRLVFTEISLTEAHRLLWEREERMKIAAYQIKKHFNR
ncbi:KipI antagonist [Virgibacillus halophilus]|uniref:KipI antagonist n=1 Tax=Tigheibacillus halophilus TaxID=361280 RepID=A0ABU5C210_9BACI|nr:KipI antagonist [Virgibacillus halophilus]